MDSVKLFLFLQGWRFICVLVLLNIKWTNNARNRWGIDRWWTEVAPGLIQKKQWTEQDHGRKHWSARCRPTRLQVTGGTMLFFNESLIVVSPIKPNNVFHCIWSNCSCRPHSNSVDGRTHYRGRGSWSSADRVHKELLWTVSEDRNYDTGPARHGADDIYWPQNVIIMPITVSQFVWIFRVL